MNKDDLYLLGESKTEQFCYLAKLFTDGTQEDIMRYGETFEERFNALSALFCALPEEEFVRLMCEKGADRTFKRLSDIQESKTEWLWKPYIPLGKITLLTADPGTGKTFFCLYLAATVSSGRPFWGENKPREPKAVVYQTAEDGYGDTIIPRLKPMEPNFDNIFMIDESETALNLTDSRIEKALQVHKPALMVFDPLQAYLGADVDMHRANEVRPVLAHIGRLAEKYNCAMVFIMHNSKMSGSQALYRALGSIDIPAIARSMLIMGNDPEDRKQKLICHEKSSLAEHGQTIKLHIAPEFGGVVFDGFSSLSADDILSAGARTRDKPSAEKDEVKEQLIEIMGDAGAAKLEDIEAMREMGGWSKNTLYRAKDDLCLKSVSIGFSKDKKTYWLLPETDVDEFKAYLAEKPSITPEDDILL